MLHFLLKTRLMQEVPCDTNRQNQTEGPPRGGTPLVISGHTGAFLLLYRSELWKRNILSAATPTSQEMFPG